MSVDRGRQTAGGDDVVPTTAVERQRAGVRGRRNRDIVVPAFAVDRQSAGGRVFGDRDLVVAAAGVDRHVGS